MEESNKGWVLAFWFYFGILMAIIISAYLRILPVKSSTIPYYDTIGHFILLGIATFLAHLALRKRKIYGKRISIPLAPIIVVIFCVIDELLQSLSPNRTASFSDLAADLVGVMVFYWLAEKVKLKVSKGENL